MNEEKIKMTDNTSYLVLQDGSVYQGKSFGASTSISGEVVFNTSMTGYQEIITDPSYAGQIVVLTYPLIGNYGINKKDFESKKIQIAGLIIKKLSLYPSHYLSTNTLHEFLQMYNIPGICEIDTRSITKKIRNQGVLMGAISNKNIEDGVQILSKTPPYNKNNFVNKVSTKHPYKSQNYSISESAKKKILLVDYGTKFNINRILEKKGCNVEVLPATFPAKKMLQSNPDGILLSPGPGDPALLDEIVNQAKILIGQIPLMGICLGHQIIARALGAKTYKLKFGHRGANHPVEDLQTGKTYITAQNHGYAVTKEALPSEIEISHINLNDNTIEGLTHSNLSLLTIQYHAEGSPGPKDNEYLFDRFLNLIDQGKI